MSKKNPSFFHSSILIAHLSLGCLQDGRLHHPSATLSDIFSENQEQKKSKFHVGLSGRRTAKSLCLWLLSPDQSGFKGGFLFTQITLLKNRWFKLADILKASSYLSLFIILEICKNYEYWITYAPKLYENLYCILS